MGSIINCFHKCSSTVLAWFIEGFHTYGLPSRVRSDKGGENVLVADDTIKKRRPGKGSMITGPSTHNQRIELLWRDVFDGVIGFYYELFSLIFSYSLGMLFRGFPYIWSSQKSKVR